MSVALKYVRERPHPREKVGKLEEYVQLLSKHRYVVLVDITGIPAQILSEVRRTLRGRGVTLKVIKNRLFMNALERVPGKNPSALAGKLVGQNAVLFTIENPFALLMFIRKYRLSRRARPGDVATSDMVVPAGNTGILPGPAMSIFGRFKIPVKVQEGSMWVTADTVVAKRGDVITAELAELLNKLNLKPIEVSITAKVIMVDGRVVDPGEVNLDPDFYSKVVAEAHSSAVNLALNAYIPLPEAMPIFVIEAYAEARALAIALAVPIPEVIPELLARASAEGSILFNFIKQRNSSFA